MRFLAGAVAGLATLAFIPLTQPLAKPLARPRTHPRRAAIHRTRSADRPDLFDPGKMSTESLIGAVNTCTDRAIAGLKKKHRYHDPRRERLSAREYCACMMDASQAFPGGKGISKAHAKRCLEHAGNQVDAYLRGKPMSDRDIFDSSSYPTSTVYTVHLICMQVHSHDRMSLAKRSRYCGCIIDGMRTEKNADFDAYLYGREPLKMSWRRRCQAAHAH